MAAAEPISARIFRKRAKSSTTKLPLKATSLPSGSSQHDDAGDHQRAATDAAIDQPSAARSLR